MLLAFALLAAQAASPPAETPTPTPTAPLGRSFTPTDGRTKTLSDIARERKIEKEKGIAPKSKGSVTVAQPGVTPGPVTPEDKTTRAAGGEPHVYVESVDHNDAVGSTGTTTVFGKLRNSGDVPACGLRVAVRLYDERGTYLCSGEASLDQSQMAPGEAVSFSITVQVPPGVAGRQRDRASSQNRGTTVVGATIEGHWRYLGLVEGEVRSARPCGAAAPDEKKPEAPEPTPPPKLDP